jgi:AAA domain
MFARDSTFLARLVKGNMNKDRAALDLPGLSPILQPVARRLLSALPPDRPPIWDDFLAGRLRPDPIIPPAPTGRPVEPERRVRLTCAVDLEPCAVDWLWSGRVPLGMITMFAGDPKLGKSYVTLAMAAALSRGLPCR